MPIRDDGELSDEERRGQSQELAREIGALQKQARELERREMAARPARARSYRKVPRQVLFLGGAHESSEAEDADEAFRTADLLRSRRVRETEQAGDVARYKSGKKKGQPRFDKEGTLKERNERTLSKSVGKRIRITILYDQLSEGGRVTKEKRTTRTIVYREYDGLVRAYQDQMRATIKKKSPDAYYVKAISWKEVEPSKPKRKPKRKPARPAKPAKRKAPTRKRGGKKKKRTAAGRAATGRKRTAKRGRRVGKRRKSTKKSSRAAKRR